MLHVTQHCLSTGSIYLFSKCDLFFSFMESLAKVPADSFFWKHTLMTELLCCSSVYLQGTQKSLFLVSISCLTAAKLRIAFSASLSQIVLGPCSCAASSDVTPQKCALGEQPQQCPPQTPRAQWRSVPLFGITLDLSSAISVLYK